MDFRRTVFLEYWRMFAMSPLIRKELPTVPGANAALALGNPVPPFVRIKWYWSPPGALRFPTPQIWSADDWDNQYERCFDLIGPDPFLPKAYTNGKTPRGVVGQFFCGRLSQFQTAAANPNQTGLRRRVDGIPFCCIPEYRWGLVLTGNPIKPRGSVGWLPGVRIPAGSLAWTSGKEFVSAIGWTSGKEFVSAIGWTSGKEFVSAIGWTSGKEFVSAIGWTSGIEFVSRVGWGPVGDLITLSALAWSGAELATPAGNVGWGVFPEISTVSAVGWADFRSDAGLLGWNGALEEVFAGGRGWGPLEIVDTSGLLAWGPVPVPVIGWTSEVVQNQLLGWTGAVTAIVAGLYGLTTIAIGETGSVGFASPLPAGLGLIGRGGFASQLGLIGWNEGSTITSVGGPAWTGSVRVPRSIGWAAASSFWGIVGILGGNPAAFIPGGPVWTSLDPEQIGSIVWTYSTAIPGGGFSVMAEPAPPPGDGPAFTLVAKNDNRVP